MKRVATCISSAVVAAVAGLLWVGPNASASQQSAVLHVGQVVQIAGTTTKCAVARRGGATVVECLPLNPRSGSYGSVTSDRRVSVVRFRSTRVAKTVFVARQHAGSATCK